MSFEAFTYAQKRVRTRGTREWKLWFSEREDGLDFRLLTKDSANDCYVSLNGTAQPVSGDSPILEDDNEDAYPADHFRFQDENGTVDIYLEQDHREFVWTRATGEYDREDCSFTTPGPLLPEIAG
jgi:hypothetical protein